MIRAKEYLEKVKAKVYLQEHIEANDYDYVEVDGISPIHAENAIEIATLEGEIKQLKRTMKDYRMSMNKRADINQEINKLESRIASIIEQNIKLD